MNLIPQELLLEVGIPLEFLLKIMILLDFSVEKSLKSKPLTFQSVGSYQRIRSGMFSLDRISSKHCYVGLDRPNLCLGMLIYVQNYDNIFHSIMMALTVKMALIRAQVL